MRTPRPVLARSSLPEPARAARPVNNQGEAIDELADVLADKVAERLLPRLLAALDQRSDDANDPLFVRVPAYAERTGVSERKMWDLVAKGLPTIGAGRARRVDVRAADEWLRAQAALDVNDALERRARLDARRLAQAKVTTRRRGTRRPHEPGPLR